MLTINKYLTSTQIKLIALALMVLDHIYEFFSYTGSVPIWFTMLGRLSLPLFIFCAVEGFYHTRDRKKYMLRLFVFYLIMEVSRYLLMFTLPRPDNFFIQNNIFGTMLITVLAIYCIDRIKAYKRDTRHLFLYSIILMTILPLAPLVEGGWFYVFLGIVLYYTRQNRLAQAIEFIVVCLAVWATDNSFQWMMTFAVLIIMLYNGEKGKGYKYLFYIFYPVHIWLLYILSVIFYT